MARTSLLLGAILAARPLLTPVLNTVGVNVEESGISFPLFTDVSREGRVFQTTARTAPAPMGADGWPTSDTCSIVMHEGDNTQPWYAGAYTFSYTGGGTPIGTDGCTASGVTFSGGVTSGTLTVAPGAGLIAMNFSGLGAGVGLKNFQCIRPEGLGTGFRADAIAHYSQFAYCRWMWLQSAWNDTTTTDWSTRPTPTLNRVGRQNYYDNSGATSGNQGLPIEVIVPLSNAIGKDAWFCVPIKGTDDYVSNFAAYLRDNCTAPRIYIELGNEIWNGVGGAKGAAQTLANAYEAANPMVINWDGNAPSGSFACLLRWQSIRTLHIAQTFQTVFGATPFASRVRIVLANQASALTNTDDMLATIARQATVKNFIYALSNAIYVCPNPTTSYASAAALSADLLAWQGASINGLTASAGEPGCVENYAWMAANYGIKYIGYEGGQAVAPGFVTPNAATDAWAADASAQGVVEDYMSRTMAYMESMAYFAAGVSKSTTQYGSNFSLTTSAAALVARTAPKLKGLLTAIAAGPTVVTKNTIAAPGTATTIDGRLYADNAATGAFPSLAPFPSYLRYLLRAPVAGTYLIKINVTTTGSGVCDLIVNGVTVAMGVVLMSGLVNMDIPLASVTLKAGPNTIQIGRLLNGVNATINSIKTG